MNSTSLHNSRQQLDSDKLAHVQSQQEIHQHTALGAITETLKFLFKLLDPWLTEKKDAAWGDSSQVNDLARSACCIQIKAICLKASQTIKSSGFGWTSYLLVPYSSIWNIRAASIAFGISWDSVWINFWMHPSHTFKGRHRYRSICSTIQPSELAKYQDFIYIIRSSIDQKED